MPSTSSLLARLKLTNGIHNNNEKNLSRKSFFSLANNCCNLRQCRAQIYTVHIPNMQIEMYACTLFLRTHAVIKLKIDREFYGILDWKVIAVDFNNLNWTDFLNRNTQARANTRAQTFHIQLQKLSLCYTFHVWKMRLLISIDTFRTFQLQFKVFE